MRKIWRREWIKTVSAAVASLFMSAVHHGSAAGKGTSPGSSRRFAMVIDVDRCMGCNACSVACKAENGVRLGAFRSWVSEKETGTYPAVIRRFLPRLCNHCENPPCLKICPTGATYRRDDGIIGIDKTICIGCRHCMNACPYQARYFNPDTDAAGDGRYPSQVPGTVDKCDFCLHRVDNGVVPSCVNTCPANARVFGDLNDPESQAHAIVAGGATETLLPRFGTSPSVFYVGGDPSVFEGE